MNRLHSILAENSAAGIEISLQNGGAMIFRATILKKDKKKIAIDKHLSPETIDSLQELIGSEMPVHLSIGGKGVIHKKVSTSATEHIKSLLQKVLPNAAGQDFYVQRYPVNPSELYISVVRRDLIDKLLADLYNRGLNVVSLSLGPFSVGAVIPLLGIAGGEELKFSGQKINIAEQRISQYELADTNGAGEKVEVAGENIPGHMLVSFASAFQYFLGDEQDAGVQRIVNAREEYRQKRKFRIALTGVLSAFFILLLGNYFWFTQLSVDYGILDQKLASHNLLLSELDRMRGEVARREKFMEQAGLLQASKVSLYADELAMDVPETIRLKAMSIYPLIRKDLGASETMNFLPRVIRMRGTCERSTDLNEWIKAIKSKDWVSHASVVNYSQDASSKSGDFNIEIGIK